MTKTITRDLGIKIFETDVIGVYAVYKHGVFFCFTMEPSNPKWFGAAARPPEAPRYEDKP